MSGNEGNRTDGGNEREVCLGEIVVLLNPILRDRKRFSRERMEMMGMRIRRTCFQERDWAGASERESKRESREKTPLRERDSPSHHGLKDDREQAGRNGWMQ